MRDYRKYFPVNWIDGMKINKNHFIEQDNAAMEALQEMTAVSLSPLRYGLLPASVAGEESFDVSISLDNQEAVRVSVIACQAVTTGGVKINLPIAGTNNTVTQIFPFTPGNTDSTWWIFLMVHPFEKEPIGSADHAENPPRLPHLVPSYSLQLVSDSNYKQYTGNPYGLVIGKMAVSGSSVRVEHDYIPPCFSIAAHPDLVSLHGELDNYLAGLELYCAQIVQKIFRKEQKNDISELVMFLCDRVMLHLGQAITNLRWTQLYAAPVELFAGISALARVMKNCIDLRTGSGKDELMNYLGEWCELKQGELESLLGNLANTNFYHNDINRNIQQVVVFVKVTTRLFDTLSKLEFIGKKKDNAIFLKEEAAPKADAQDKAKRRFFG